MNRTWKERLYDVSCSRITEKYIPVLLIVLGLLSLVCMITFTFMVECQLLSTFLCNKIRNSLLANEAFLSSILYWPLMIIYILIVGIIFNPDTYSFRVTVCIGLFVTVLLILVICKPISKYFKKKLVYVETENTNVKYN